MRHTVVVPYFVFVVVVPARVNAVIQYLLAQILLLNFQQSFGPGTLEVLGNITSNGQVVDLGNLVLDDTDLQVLSITPADGSTNVALKSPHRFPPSSYPIAT